MISNDAYAAATRFGLGARPDEIDRIARNPKHWVIEQIDAPETTSGAFDGLPTSAQNMQKVFELREQKQEGVAKQEVHKEIRQDEKLAFTNEILARLRHAITTPKPFCERMVD